MTEGWTDGEADGWPDGIDGVNREIPVTPMAQLCLPKASAMSVKFMVDVVACTAVVSICDHPHAGCALYTTVLSSNRVSMFVSDGTVSCCVTQNWTAYQEPEATG